MQTTLKSVETKVFRHEKLEKHHFLIKILRIFVVPLLNLIPANVLQSFVRKSSNYAANVLERPGSTHALETMYTRDRKKKRNSFTDMFWHNVVSQPKAVRNRLKIVESLLESEIREIGEKKESIKICNIGGGSSRAIIQTIERLKSQIHANINVICIDRDERALELGRLTSKEHGAEHNFTWIQGDARNIRDLVEPDSIDIVEMVGLLDYFDNASSVGLIKQIYNILKKDGVFIVANVHPNPESKFVRNVGWPAMHYKTSEDMARILTESGFREESFSLVFEPLRVHIVGIAKKK